MAETNPKAQTPPSAGQPPVTPPVETPKATPPAAEPPKAKAAKSATPPENKPSTQRIQEKLPDALVKGLAVAGYKPEDIMSIGSYAEQKLWRTVTTDGRLHEFDFEGNWLTKPAPKPEPKAAK